MPPTYTRLSPRQRFDNFVDTRGGALKIALIGALAYVLLMGIAFAATAALPRARASAVVHASPVAHLEGTAWARRHR